MTPLAIAPSNAVTSALSIHPEPTERYLREFSDPLQSPELAEASRFLGYTPMYAEGDGGTALIQIRGAARGLKTRLSRAYVIAAPGHPSLLLELTARLKRLGFPFVRIGNTMSGITEQQAQSFDPTLRIPRHTFILDLTQTEAALRAGIKKTRIQCCGKADTAGVTVRSVNTPQDIEAFMRLAVETARRASTKGINLSCSANFHETVLRSMCPGGSALMTVACHGDRAVAGGLFIIRGETLIYYQGSSSSNPEDRPLQGPSALIWHAIRWARSRGLRRFDFGGCTPDLPLEDPRHGVYLFKASWGGRLETFYNVEIPLSSLVYSAQQSVIGIRARISKFSAARSAEAGQRDA